MKNALRKTCLFTFGCGFILLLFACSRHKDRYDTDDTAIDTVKTGYLKDTFDDHKYKAALPQSIEYKKFCVADEKAVVFDDTMKMTPKTVLKFGDTVNVVAFGDFAYPDQYCQVYFNNNGVADSGYMKGKTFAAVFPLENGDGFFAFRYLEYKEDDYPGNLAELIWAKGQKIISKMHFYTYQYANIRPIPSQAFAAQGVKFYELTGAPDACASICNVLFYTHAEKIDTVCTNWTWENADADWADINYIFPDQYYGKPAEVGTYYRSFEGEGDDKPASLTGRRYTRYAWNGERFERIIR